MSDPRLVVLSTNSTKGMAIIGVRFVASVSPDVQHILNHSGRSTIFDGTEGMIVANCSAEVTSLVVDICARSQCGLLN